MSRGGFNALFKSHPDAAAQMIGLSFQAGLLIGVLKTAAAVNVCERDSNAASSADRSAANSA